MSKRKKKVKRWKTVVISSFGLSGAVERNETEPIYQRKFCESDMMWLADQYQKQQSSDPSLTLEEFAAQYGVPADELRLHVPETNRDFGYCITLWHGTTSSRAKSILKEGFRVKKEKKRRIFFARSRAVARRYALGRARREEDQPSVLMCSIDLNRYNDHEWQGNEAVAFKYDCIDKEVVVRATGLTRQHDEKTEKKRETSVDFTNVALTFNSERAGIAYWINSYLQLSDPDRISEDHEAVGKIKQWLDDQISAGRFGVVPEDEILQQLRKYMPES